MAINSGERKVSLAIENKVRGQKKLEQYVETLKEAKKQLELMPKSVVLSPSGAKDYTKQLDTINDSLNRMKKSYNSTEKATKNAFNVGKLMAYTRALKTLTTSIARFTAKSSEYVENINLYQVAFNGAYEGADRFINKTAEMYGLDESKLTKSVGIFKQLTNAMNIAADTGEKLSTLLTQMSIDISSLYNVDIERAMSVLQSAMSGQTRPIRSVTGADVTIATLQEALKNIGIDKYINDLSYAEKRLLIVISLTKQLTQATDDFGRTIESPANQMRILSEQWQRLSRAVGNLFLPILGKVLPYLNAILMVLTEIINIFATLLGFKIDKFDYFGSINDSIDDMGVGLGEANKQAEKLKRGLRGFDKLNNITSQSGSGVSGGAGVGGGIDPRILKEFDNVFADYNKRLSEVKMQATRIRDRIMEWLGFTIITDEKTKDVSFKFDHITSGTVLGALGVGGVIYKGVKTILSLLNKIGILDFGLMTKAFGKFSIIAKKTFAKNSGIMKFLGANPKILLISASLTALAGVTKLLYDKSESFRESVDKFVDTLKETFQPTFEELKELVVPTLKKASEIMEMLYKEVLKPLGNLLLETLEPILSTIFDVLTLILKEVVQPLMPYIEKLSTTLLKSIGNTLENIGIVLSELTKVVSWLWKNIVSPFVNFILEKFETGIKPLLDNIKNTLSFLHTYILEPLFTMIKAKIETNVIPAVESIGYVVENIRRAIQRVVDWWNNLTFNKKRIQVEGGGGGGGRAFANGGILVHNQWKPIEQYATGGLPPVGQMFVARERGPELVGKIGSNTAIMNNDQIVSSVSDGVYRAVSMAQRGSNNSNQVFNLYLDANHKLGTYTLDQLQDLARQNGEPITIG